MPSITPISEKQPTNDSMSPFGAMLFEGFSRRHEFLAMERQMFAALKQQPEEVLSASRDHAPSACVKLEVES